MPFCLLEFVAHPQTNTKTNINMRLIFFFIMILYINMYLVIMNFDMEKYH